MKTITLMLAILFATCLQANTPPVDKHILLCFKRAFPQVEQVNWAMEGNYWVAGFKVDGKLSILYYNEDGEVVLSRRYYGADDLPLFIRARLYKRYTGKTVYGVTEITKGNMVNYSIVMQDEKRWYVIEASSDGVMQQVKKFNKV